VAGWTGLESNQIIICGVEREKCGARNKKNVESKILTNFSLEWPAHTVSQAETAQCIELS